MTNNDEIFIPEELEEQTKRVVQECEKNSPQKMTNTFLVNCLYRIYDEENMIHVDRVWERLQNTMDLNVLQNLQQMYVSMETGQKKISKTSHPRFQSTKILRSLGTITAALVIGALLGSMIVAINFAHQRGGIRRSSAGTQKETTTLSQPQQVFNVPSDRFVYDTPESMCNALMVADVTVGTIGQSYWNVTSRSTLRLIQGSHLGPYMLYTPLQFTHMHILLDHRLPNPLTQKFVMVGGKQGNIQIHADGFPQLEPSRRYLVVFAPARDATAKTNTQKWLVVYDAYPINDQNSFEFQQKTTEPGTGGQEVKIPLSQLIQTLHGCH